MASKVRLLLLTDQYAPAFSPRMVSFVYELRKAGYELLVFTIEPEGHLVMPEGAEQVYRMPYKRARGRGKRLGQWLSNFFWQEKECRFERFVLETFQREQLVKPDLILAFSYQRFPFRSASRLSQRWGIPWVADCRDLIEQHRDSLPQALKLGSLRFKLIEQLITKVYISQRNRALRTASRLVTVSQWHQQYLRQLFSIPTKLIYNGYDARYFYPMERAGEPYFLLVFTGRLLSLEMRDPRLVLEAARELQGECPRLRLRCYVDEPSKEILEALPEWDEGCMQVSPMVRYDRVGEILNSASLVLLINSASSAGGAKGMISSKLFEALAVEKPILLCPEEEGEAAELLRASGRGLASNSLAEIKAYIREWYKRWQEEGKTHLGSNLEFVSQFDRAQTAAQLVQLIEEILKEK